jgi:hypothetical protein
MLLPSELIPLVELVISGEAAVPLFPATMLLRIKKLTFVVPR